jgi:exonuclease VII small subunit
MFQKKVSIAVATGLASAAFAAPANAQADRMLYQPLLETAVQTYANEREIINSLQEELLEVTDIERGCELLHESRTHLGLAKEALDDVLEYSDLLNRRNQEEAAEREMAIIDEQIGLKDGDIANYCT